MSASGPYIEIEVKIRYPAGAAAARDWIETHGFSATGKRILESDQLFDRSDGELRGSDRILRLRRSGDVAIVTYKGPGTRERYKSREEIEFDVSDPEAFVRMIGRLGYLPGFRYEKYRTKFEGAGAPFADGQNSGVVSIDETPIGVFLELEGTTEWIDQTAARLGFPPAEYLTSSYGSLYADYRRDHPEVPADMTFTSLRPM